ncbi:MAG: hypothetical protein WCK02_03365 [Bacteroidota bacterium]
MFKKVSHISLIVLLLAYTMGLTIYKHYCGSAFVNQTVLVEPHRCCGDACTHCHDEVKQFKITDSFENSDFSFNIKSELNQFFEQLFVPISVNIATINQVFSNCFFYKAKICENNSHPSSISFSFLQSFRL